MKIYKYYVAIAYNSKAQIETGIFEVKKQIKTLQDIKKLHKLVAETINKNQEDFIILSFSYMGRK